MAAAQAQGPEAGLGLEQKCSWTYPVPKEKVVRAVLGRALCRPSFYPDWPTAHQLLDQWAEAALLDAEASLSQHTMPEQHKTLCVLPSFFCFMSKSMVLSRQ